MAPKPSSLPQRGLARRLALLAISPRLILLMILFLGMVGAATARLYRLQVLESDQWVMRAVEQRARLVRLTSPRGLIYSQDGRQLVRNIPTFQVTVIPALLPEDDLVRETMLRRLAVLLDMPYSQPNGPPGLLEKVEQGWLIGPYEPVVVADDVSRETALIVAQGQSIAYHGVRVAVISKRQYPFGALVSQLVGYLGAIPAEETESFEAQGYDPTTDQVGYAGIEYSLEDWLRGQPGWRYQEEDVLGRVVQVVGSEQSPQPGNNVYLTIDLELQQVAQDALARAMAQPNVNARRGVVIALDPRNGAIKAMVSLPTYDDNLFAEGISEADLQALLEDPHLPLVNHAISDQLPPGSIFKIIPAAGALQTGVLTPRTRLECPGTIMVPNKYYPNDPGKAQPFYCWLPSPGHGFLDIVHGLAYSCDIFFYKTGGGFEEDGFEGLGLDRLVEYAGLFGLGEQTGVDLPAEASGLVPTAQWKRLTKGENWSTGDTYNLSIGQGYLLVTPLQMVNVMAAAANGGKIYEPQIIDHITDADGNVIRPFQPEIRRTLVVSPENWTLIQEGLEGAVAYGTSKRTQVDGVRIAGKTGTAQYCDDLAIDLGICRQGLAQPTHAWFLSFAPVEAPEIALVVFIYNGGEGSITAVPVAHEILEWYFHERD